MPKILNDTAQKRLQEQDKGADDKKNGPSSLSKSEIHDEATRMEASMDLDNEVDMVVDQDVVVDVKDTEEEGKNGGKVKETATAIRDGVALETPAAISLATSSTIVTTTTTTVTATTKMTNDNISDDVDMSVAARDTDSDKVKDSSPSEDTAIKILTEDAASSEESRAESDLINISLV